VPEPSVAQVAEWIVGGFGALAFLRFFLAAIGSYPPRSMYFIAAHLGSHPFLYQPIRRST
jgi:hypothetical protein